MRRRRQRCRSQTTARPTILFPGVHRTDPCAPCTRLAQVSFRWENSTEYGFQVRGTRVGTQTFYSEASYCDHSIP